MSILYVAVDRMIKETLLKGMLLWSKAEMLLFGELAEGEERPRFFGRTVEGTRILAHNFIWGPISGPAQNINMVT